MIAPQHLATDGPAGTSVETPSRLGLVDVHVHVLPGLDDGPVDMQEALALCRALADDGVHTAVASPHQLGIHEENGRARVLPACEHLNGRLMDAGIRLEVLPGGDVRIDPELLDRLDSGQAVTIADGGKFLLLELPDEVLFDLDKVIFDLRRRGITVVLSHPERHCRLPSQVPLLQQWVDRGMCVQLTAASLTGELGQRPAQAAWDLLDRGLSHLVASDAHSTHSRPPRMRAAYQLVRDRRSEELAVRLFRDNPARVVAGIPIDDRLPQRAAEPRGKRFRWW